VGNVATEEVLAALEACGARTGLGKSLAELVRHSEEMGLRFAR